MTNKKQPEPLSLADEADTAEDAGYTSARKANAYYLCLLSDCSQMIRRQYAELETLALYKNLADEYGLSIFPDIAEMTAELETLRAKLKVYEDLGDAGSDVQLLRTGYAAARLEIESLKSERDRFRAAYHEWSDKTEWVRKSTTLNELGKHLADVLRERIEGLQAALKAAQPVAAPQPGAAYAALTYKQVLGSKNCMQCCVSYMLGLPLESVPDFATDGGWELFSDFAESQGYAAVMLPGNREFEADYLASGTTARGTSHMVVMNDGKLVHDPHPSNAGLVDVQCVWLLAKRATPRTVQADEHAEFETAAKAYTSNVNFERDGTGYADMTAELLWHGWKLRASHGQAPAQAAPAAVAGSSEFPHEKMDAVALGRYKVVSSDQSMFYRFAVVAGDGAQQLYIGREVDCQNMARKFAGAFLDGAFAYHSMTAAPTAQPAPQQEAQKPFAWHVCSVNSDGSLSLEHAAAWEEAAHEHINDAITEHDIEGAGSWVVRPAYHAPQPSPTAQAEDSVQEDAARYRWLREGNDAKHGAAWHVAVNLYGCEWDAAIDAAMNKGATP